MKHDKVLRLILIPIILFTAAESGPPTQAVTLSWHTDGSAVDNAPSTGANLGGIGICSLTDGCGISLGLLLDLVFVF